MQRVLLLIFFVIIGCAVWSYGSGGIIAILLEPGIAAEARLASVKLYFDAWGLAAPLAYVAIVVIEVVVAPIPGLLLYLPGGAIFGWIVGGMASLAGNVIGAGLACSLSRSLAVGKGWFSADGTKLSRYRTMLESRGFWVVLFLRLNPLTSSDLVSYAAGLTRVPAWKVMAGTAAGMTPLCFLQAYFAQELFTVFPVLIYPLLFVAAGYVVYVIRVMPRALGRP